MGHPKLKAYSPEYLAAQTAGSFRMEGIRVSKEREKRMCDVIAGKVDVVSLRASVVDKYKRLGKVS